MPQCINIKKKKRQICIGDMHDQIILSSRALTPPNSGGVDFTEEFTPKVTIWSMVNTVAGETIFDGTGIEFSVTHRIYIRFLTGVTAEDWIEFDGERLDVLDVEDLDERHTFMLLRCGNRGTTANVANQL